MNAARAETWANPTASATTVLPTADRAFTCRLVSSTWSGPEKQTLTAGRYIPVQLRWESALPIRLAELKSNSTEAPAVEAGGYVVAVYGIPPSNVKGTPKSLGEPLKKLAVLKRPGKADVRPVEVEVLQQEDGTIVLYRFPSAAEITKGDGRFDSQAQIGRVFVSQSFDPADMYFGGNMEL